MDKGRPTFLTPEEVAQLLRVDVQTIRRLIRRGELRATRVGRHWRIHQDDLARFLDAHASAPPAETDGRIDPQPGRLIE